MSENVWFYLATDANGAVNRGAQEGPTTIDAVASLYKSKLIVGETMVWGPGLPTWTPVNEVGICAPVPFRYECLS